jgi:hypothetical protein
VPLNLRRLALPDSELCSTIPPSVRVALAAQVWQPVLAGRWLRQASIQQRAAEEFVVAVGLRSGEHLGPEVEHRPAGPQPLAQAHSSPVGCLGSEPWDVVAALAVPDALRPWKLPLGLPAGGLRAAHFPAGCCRA